MDEAATYLLLGTLCLSVVLAFGVALYAVTNEEDEDTWPPEKNDP